MVHPPPRLVKKKGQIEKKWPPNAADYISCFLPPSPKFLDPLLRISGTFRRHISTIARCGSRGARDFATPRIQSHVSEEIWATNRICIRGSLADPGFGQGGPRKFRPYFCRCSASEASINRPGSRARLRALELWHFFPSNMHSPGFLGTFY